jgi:hypothetical protein
MAIFEFVKELPAKVRTHPDEQCERWLIDKFVVALKAHPWMWAKWPAEISSETAGAYRSGIKKSVLRAFRDGSYDATRRNGTLYVRYIGEVRDGA